MLMYVCAIANILYMSIGHYTYAIIIINYDYCMHKELIVGDNETTETPHHISVHCIQYYIYILHISFIYNTL